VLDHVDLVVTSLERSLPWYRALLGTLGPISEGPIRGERGEVVVYLNGEGNAAVGLREAQEDGAVRRYAPGMHHLALRAPSREVVDACAALDVHIEDGPCEWPYAPGYYAVFLRDPDDLKIEVVHRPR
jgi:glyoxylase I family protein